MTTGLELDHRYRLDAELGRGGMGVVYRAYDTRLEREVAIKILSTAALTDQGRQRLLREARAVARLSHPNIIPVFDAGEAQVPGHEHPLPYIVMAYVEGVSLLDHQPDGLTEIINITIQVSDALEHAQKQGVVHRDLKPENILITPEGKAMLMDFGLASAGASRLTTEGTILGTVFYLAPELALGQEFDGRADLYALGVLLYELATGQLPFSADDPVAVIGQHLHASATPPHSLNPDISEALNDLILQMLSKDPAGRPASAGEVSEALKGIREGTPSPEMRARPELPAFLKDVDQKTRKEIVFVARERELASLEQFLEGALAGQGGMAFITGGPGSGKTAIMEAFSRRAQAQYPELLAASGKCNAYTGTGDPYSPFREVLGDLTGDVEAKWAAGTISREHAIRLWQIMPDTVQVLVDHAPDLVDVFTSGRDLLSRLSKAAPERGALLQSLRRMTDGARATPGELEQKALFEQYLEVLCHLSSKRPLLILLDDLQWADSASLNLLFHLGREIPGGRILLMGAYRPEEVALGRGGQRHPLEDILAEFKRLYGDIWIDLSAESTDEGRAFVIEFLNKEPNRFSGDFREALFAHTEGHPLFTIELLREMQGRGDLAQDEDGNWVEGESLNWNRLPARVEGVIEARIGRLEEELREILTIASVEGEDFTAQVVARVKEASERELVRQLSGELDKVHRLIGERGTLQIAEEQLYLYRFRHSLFQQHIYNGLGEFERKLLHKQVGMVLETLYGDRVETILPQLALHFSQAGVADKASHYALLAGDQARLMYAHQEAIDFYQRAIGYLKEQGDFERAARTLMKLGLTYHAIFDFQHARRAYDEAFAMRRREIKERKATVEAAPHPFRMPANTPPTLDPTTSGDETSKFYIESIFSGLVELDAGNEILPDIANSWEISADGCKYIFHLRDDVIWGDGTQVTASDFVYALKRTLNPATKAPLGATSLFYDILNARAYHMGEISDPDQLGVRAIDDLTLEVVLERPASYFLHLLTILYPVPQHVVELHGEAWTEMGNLVSNGPFLLASYQPGETITLTSNPAYHGRFAGNLQDVELLLDIPFGSTEALERYEKDRIDIVFLDPGTYYARHSHIEEYISEPTPGTYCVGFDTSSPPFDDVRVRRAFAMSLDRQKLADEVYMGEHYPAMGGFVPPGLPGHSPGIALPYDPDQARHLLAQAGYPGGLGFPNLEIARPDLATIDYLKDQLAHNLNIEVTTRKMSWTDVLDKKQTWNFFIVSWNHDYPDPDDFLRVAIRSSIPHWRNETYDSLLEGAQRSLNQDERLRLYQAADKILIEEAALIPCWYFWNHMLVKPWVSIAGGSTINLYLKDVVIEPH